MKFRNLLIFSLLFILHSCKKDDTATPDNLSKPTNELDVKYVKRIMETAYNAVKNQGVFALEASRVYAYTAISAYESMVHGIEGGKSLVGQLNSLHVLPRPAENKEYNWALVMNISSAEVLEKTFATISTTTQNLIWTNTSSMEAELILDYQITNEVKQNSYEYGKLLATAILEWSKSDRASVIGTLPFTMPSTSNNPQYYDGNGVGTAFFMMPFWWTSRPFAISSHAVCPPEPPYSYSENPSSDYYKDVLEVYESTKDPVKLATGRYWANNPKESGTPAGSWVGIQNQLIDQLKLDIVTALQLYVTLTVSTRDAFIAVWYTKYQWNLQRPVSFIRKMMKGEQTWVSPVPTPPYPDYVSGTSANAGSSSEILTSFLGARSFTDNQHADKNFKARTYINFKQAGVEAFHSRIYAGVHMRKACEEGFKLGECVAKQVMEKIKFK